MSGRVVVVGGGVAEAGMARRLERRVPDADIRLACLRDLLSLLARVRSRALVAGGTVELRSAPEGLGVALAGTPDREVWT